jgi:hypothetical protein
MDEQCLIVYWIISGAKLGNFWNLDCPGSAIVASSARLPVGLRHIPARATR